MRKILLLLLLLIQSCAYYEWRDSVETRLNESMVIDSVLVTHIYQLYINGEWLNSRVDWIEGEKNN